MGGNKTFRLIRKKKYFLYFLPSMFLCYLLQFTVISWAILKDKLAYLTLQQENENTMNRYSLSINQGTPSFIHLCSFFTEQVYNGIYTEKKLFIVSDTKGMLSIIISEPESCQQEWGRLASPTHSRKLRWVDLQHSVRCLYFSCILSRIIPKHWYTLHSCRGNFSLDL